jgi:hypothetical protein
MRVFFFKLTELLEGAAHGGFADADLGAGVEVFAEGFEGGVGLLFDDLVEEIKALEVDAWAGASAIFFGFEGSGLAEAFEPILDGSKADTKASGEIALRAFATLISLNDTHAQII